MSVHNVTIDDADTSGIIVYSNSRISGWADQTCSTCFAKPIDLSQVFDGTWHDTTHMEDDSTLAAHFLFTGSAIYVYGIQVNSTSGIPIVNNSLIFTLDGQPAGFYDHTPNDPNYAYNVNFFAQSDLSFGPHNLTMAVNGTSMVLLDYIVYTTNSSTPVAAPTSLSNPKPPSNHAGAIAGGVIGGFVGLAILIMLVWALFFRRRRGGVSMVSMLPETPMPKTEDDQAHRPAVGILSRFHGHGDSPAAVDPFTIEDQQGANLLRGAGDWNGGKNGMAQRRDRETHASMFSGGSTSRAQPPSSVDPPTSLPSSGAGSPPVSPGMPSSAGLTSSAGTHSPTPSQSVSNIVPPQSISSIVPPSSTSATSAGADAGHSDLELANSRKHVSTIEEREEAPPPAYGTSV